jgi:hypothetical protein
MPRQYRLKFAEGAHVDESFLDFVDGLFAELKLSPELAQLAASRWQDYTGKRVQTETLQAEAAADRQVKRS